MLVDLNNAASNDFIIAFLLPMTEAIRRYLENGCISVNIIIQSACNGVIAGERAGGNRYTCSIAVRSDDYPNGMCKNNMELSEKKNFVRDDIINFAFHQNSY